MMLKFTFYILSSFLFSTILNSQSIQWQKSFGGSDAEAANCVKQTSDGGYIVAGRSRSANGNLTINHGSNDYWIVRLDAAGTIVWQKSMGGSFDDQAKAVLQTTDGGFIVAGVSNSTDGDITDNRGGSDFWVIKLDGSGTVQWKKNYGTLNEESAFCIQQTMDGGYIIGGHSDPPGGTINEQMYIVKIDSLGGLIWSKTFPADGAILGLQQLPNGDYIFTGYCTSLSFLGVVNHGAEDGVLIKTDSGGTIRWVKLIGYTYNEGFYAVRQTADSGFIISGIAHYPSPHTGVDLPNHHGQWDYWVLKTDTAGIVQWDKYFGGTRDEFAYSIQITNDGGYIVAGSALSQDSNVTGNQGVTDCWITKLDTAGTLQWQRAMGSYANDGANWIEQTSDSGYVVGAYNGDNGGHVTGNHGSQDVWIIKMNNVLPDLLITEQTIATPIIATGQQFTATCKELNIGAGKTDLHKINFYLSADTLLTIGSNGDLLLGQHSITTDIPAGGNSGVINKQLTMPCTIAAGNYYVLFVADGAGEMPETNETNNINYFAVTVPVGVADPTPQITASPSASVCTPATVTLTATITGVCTGCTYNWNTGAMTSSIVVNSSGTYIVTVTNFCGSGSDTAIVTINPLPIINISSSATSICAGSSAQLTATGAISYNWSPPTGLSSTSTSIVTASPVTTTTYTVTGLSSAGCIGTNQVLITVTPAVIPSLTISFTGCTSGSLTFLATPVNSGTNPQYQWYVNNVLTPGSGNSFILNNAVNGTEVFAKLISSADCANPSSVNSATTTVSCITTGLPDIDGLEEFQLGPNPGIGMMNMFIKLNQANKVSFIVSDSYGRETYRSLPFVISGSINKQLDLQKMLPGIYFINFFIGNKSFVQKIVIAR